MDVQVLKTFRDTRGLEDLKKLMIPKPELKDLINCDFKSLLELRLSSVENLFKYEGSIFTMRHESNLVISKFQCGVKSGMDLNVKLEQRNGFENGINYWGVLSVNGVEIRLLGAGSYDPASHEPYLSREDYVVVTGCYTMSLFALRLAGEEAFNKVFQVFEANKACKTHKRLVEYMKYQICEGVIRRRHVKDYGRYLQEVFIGEDALKKENEDLVMYLNLFEICDEEEMLPSRRFFNELQRIGGDLVAMADVVRFIRDNENEIYLLPDPHFVKRLARKERDENISDFRLLGRKLDELEEKYSNRLKVALGNRNGKVDKQANEMGELVRPYTNCVLF